MSYQKHNNFKHLSCNTSKKSIVSGLLILVFLSLTISGCQGSQGTGADVNDTSSAETEPTHTDDQASDSTDNTHPKNSQPIAIAGQNLTTEVGRVVLLHGEGIDTDGDELSFVWSMPRRPPGSSAMLMETTSDTVSFKPDVEGNYTAELIVSDGEDDSEPSSVVINARLGNIAPVADAGINQIVAVGKTVSLNGLGSTDPNGDALSYRWLMLSKPKDSAAGVIGANTGTPTFTADYSGKYVLQLTVRDAEFESVPDTITVSAADFSVELDWAPNSDNTVGYVIYVGPSTTSIHHLARILVKGASDWDPAAPSAEIAGDTIINATAGGSNACFMIKAYNGVGQSTASETTCLSIPLP